MDEKVIRKINRQLRGIRLMLGFFMILFLAMIGILGFMAWKVLTFTHDVNAKITNIETTTQQKLDLKSQLCDGTNQNALTSQICGR
jgi:cell division protein FtsL